MLQEGAEGLKSQVKLIGMDLAVALSQGCMLLLHSLDIPCLLSTIPLQARYGSARLGRRALECERRSQLQ